MADKIFSKIRSIISSSINESLKRTTIINGIELKTFRIKINITSKSKNDLL